MVFVTERTKNKVFFFMREASHRVIAHDPRIAREGEHVWVQQRRHHRCECADLLTLQAPQ